MQEKIRYYYIPLLLALFLHLCLLLFLIVRWYNPNQSTSAPPNAASASEIIQATVVADTNVKTETKVESQPKAAIPQTKSDFSRSVMQKNIARQQLEELKQQTLIEQARNEELKKQLELLESHKLKAEYQKREMLKKEIETKRIEQQKEQKKLEEEKQLEAQKELEQAKQAKAEKLKEITRKKLEAKKKAAEMRKEALQKRAQLEQALKEEELTEQHQQFKHKKQLVERDLLSQLEQEQIDMNGTQASTTQGALDKYKARIIEAIGKHWLIPDNIDRHLSCKLLIHLDESGKVLNVRLVESSGDTALDRSAVSAVHKASPLPMPMEADLFDKFRTLSLTVRPENIL